MSAVSAAAAAEIPSAPASKSSLYDWLATTEHTLIGRRFVVTAFTFFLLGGLLAVIMRLQLARPLAAVPTRSRSA